MTEYLLTVGVRGECIRQINVKVVSSSFSRVPDLMMTYHGRRIALQKLELLGEVEP